MLEEAAWTMVLVEAAEATAEATVLVEVPETTVLLEVAEATVLLEAAVKLLKQGNCRSSPRIFLNLQC